MRVAFFGHQELGHAALEALLCSHHDVVLAVGHPPGGPSPYDHVWAASVTELAAARGVPHLQTGTANDDATLQVLREAAPEVLVSADWRSWMSPEALAVPSLAAVNVHDGLLPRYAGCAPLNWAIACGEDRAGATAHFMSDEIDMGDVILRDHVPIHEDDTAADVWPRLRRMFPQLLLRALTLLESGSAPREQQVGTTYYHRRNEHDSLIDWRRSRREIHDLIRAQSDPYPNAFTLLDGRVVRIKRARLGAPKHRGTAGRVCARTPDGVVVLCGVPESAEGQALVLLEVEPEGELPMPARAFFDRTGAQLGAATPSLTLQEECC